MSCDFVEEFEIDLTTSCNLRCPLCTRNYQHAQHLIKPEFSAGRPLNEITSQLDTFPNLRLCQLAGAISEPTLYKDLFGFIKYLKSRDIYIEMYTNASVHDEKYWEELASLFAPTDQIHFTICGSTQELHEKYRIGSNLQKVLDNAAAVRRVNPIDYGQFIRFEYNKDDDVSHILEQFTHSYKVESEGIRRLNDKMVEPAEDVRARSPRYELIERIFKNMPKNTEKCEIQCKSLKQKKVHFNADGSISPCYILCEFSDVKFDGTFDYTAILNYEYPECFLCEKRTKLFIARMGLDFIC